MNKNNTILVVDNDPQLLFSTTQILKSAGYEVIEALRGKEGFDKTREHQPDLVLLDILLPDIDGREVCKQIKADSSLAGIYVILISGIEISSESQADGLEVGADEFIARPVSDRELLARIQTMLRLKQTEEVLRKARNELEIQVEERTAELKKTNEQLQQEIEKRKRVEENLQKAFSEIKQLKDRLEAENIYLRKEIEVKFKHREITGQSHAINSVLSQIDQVAGTEATVLLLGETGTGKEVIARMIHRLSSRKGRPLIMVNCAALPAALIESELFGREKGAYTGALSQQKGRFEIADGSTLFFDEIAELSPELQAKLLRALQNGEFERLGSTKTLRVNVRVIAATNQDLARAVQEGSFRKDLYYRLNVFPITVPPLRDRREDIPLLVWAFIKEFETLMGKRIETIPRKSMEALQRYSWPGNVRELRNVIERAMIISPGKTLAVQVPGISDSVTPLNITLEDVERRHILQILEQTGWQIKGKNGAAELLGIKPTTLHSRMKKLGITRPGR